jgi:hypothetical protein
MKSAFLLSWQFPENSIPIFWILFIGWLTWLIVSTDGVIKTKLSTKEGIAVILSLISIGLISVCLSFIPEPKTSEQWERFNWWCGFIWTFECFLFAIGGFFACMAMAKEAKIK